MSIHYCYTQPWAFGSSLSPICRTSHSRGSFVVEPARDLRGTQCPWPGRPAGVLPTGWLIGLEHRLPSFPMWATAVLLHNVKQHDSRPLSQSFHCPYSTEEAEPHTKAKSDTGSLLSEQNVSFPLHPWFVIGFCWNFIDRILLLLIHKVMRSGTQPQHEQNACQLYWSHLTLCSVWDTSHGNSATTFNPSIKRTLISLAKLIMPTRFPLSHCKYLFSSGHGIQKVKNVNELL